VTGTFVAMGRESVSWYLALPDDLQDALVGALQRGGARRLGAGDARIDLCLRDPHRFWIDLRVHRGGPELCLEVRIALTNDEWSIRAPLERALAALPAAALGRPWRDGDANVLALTGEDGWSLALEQDYGRHRQAFVRMVGDIDAPICADHVYMYIHQTRWNRDNDDELAWHRERELSTLEEMWGGDEPPAV
jgi:hypothetical protein